MASPPSISERHKLLAGPYASPQVQIGDWVDCKINTRRTWIGGAFVSRWPTVVALGAILLIFLAMGVAGISE